MYPTLAGLPHFGHSNFTLEISTGAAVLTTCPFSPCFLGLKCLLFRFTPSTKIFRSFGSDLKIFAVLPLSFPEITKIVSPFRIFILFLLRKNSQNYAESYTELSGNVSAFFCACPEQNRGINFRGFSRELLQQFCGHHRHLIKSRLFNFFRHWAKYPAPFRLFSVA